MPAKKLTILQVNTTDTIGGAARAARDLHQRYQQMGHQAFMAVGWAHRPRHDETILELPHHTRRSRWSRLFYWAPRQLRQRGLKGEGRLTKPLMWLAEPRRAYQRYQGFEDFNFPATETLLALTPRQPDILHLHNLHGDYFDLRTLPALSQRIPTVFTLHDMWLFTGHCAHSIACERWRTGCGQCPDLRRYPAIRQDQSAANWQRKRAIYANSRLYVSAPSQWLLNLAQNSILQAADYRVIPYDIDLTTFHPIDDPVQRQAIRQQIGVSADQQMILCLGDHLQTNCYKDYSTVQAAIEQLAQSHSQLVFVTVGGQTQKRSQLGSSWLYEFPYQSDPKRVAAFYQAADLFLHAANADTFPTTILEALACGTPVIASAVGGIPEQIEDGVTGYLVGQGDSTAMAERVHALLTAPDKRTRMSRSAVDMMRQRFPPHRQATSYLDWYQEMLEHASILL